MITLPYIVQAVEELHRLDWGISLEIRIDSELEPFVEKCHEFDRTGKTTKKINEIWVEWMETHWLKSTIDDPERGLKKGEVYAQETSRFGKCYRNETFAKAFVMSLALGQKTTLDLDDYVHWDGFNPQTDNEDNFPTIAVRMGSYPGMSDERFQWLSERYLDISQSQRNKMKVNRLIVMNYYFDGEE